RLLLVLEARRQLLEFHERAFRLQVRVADFELDRPLLSGDHGATQRQVDQLSDRICRQIGEALLAQDRGFERELRRDTKANLFVARTRAGLVIEDRVSPRDELLDPVGAGTQRQLALTERDLDPSRGLSRQRLDAETSFALPSGKPAGDTPEARPPERLRLRI